VDAEGLTPAIRVSPGISDTFKVVVENLQCNTVNGAPRNRCLCPGAEQQLDNFMNIVVYGPKDLPSSGPVNIPKLPDGDLLEVDLVIDSSGTHDLHIFSETDEQSSFPKPQFGAFLSIGDQAAIDQTFDRDADPDVSKITIQNAEVTGAAACVGDCDGNSIVTVDELVKGVNIALGSTDVSECQAFDTDGSQTVTVDELVKGVNNALSGCAGGAG
jgi:hypothetical protein